jgi:hypothetical protein
MEPITATPDAIKTGALITFVTQRDDAPFAVPGTLRSISPFILALSADPGVRRGEKVLLLGHQATTVLRAQATVDAITRTGTQWSVQVQPEGWEHANRRRADRYTVDLPVSMSAIETGGDEIALEKFEGTFTELSQTGGWVQSDLLLPKGDLIQWQFTTNGALARGLALVIRSCPARGGMALEFVEFMGSAYGLLGSYLQEQAA